MSKRTRSQISCPADSVVCSLIVVSIISACSAGQNGVNSPSGLQPTSVASLTSPTPTTSLVQFVPTSSQETQFVVQDNQINYGRRNTLNCEYVIEGQILDIQGEAFDDIIVNINLLELEDTSSSDQVSYEYPNDGHWSALLPNMSADYEIWLTRTQGGEAVSPYIIVSARDCDSNLATINFVQIRPFD